MMHAHTVDFYILAVQEKTFIGVKRYRAKAGHSLVAVHYLSILDDVGHHLVQGRIGQSP